MRIYLAARYDRHEEMLGVAKLLEEDGHIVTSRWIHGNHESPNNDPTDACDFALEDWNDLDEADGFVTFTELSSVGYNRGGRHVEFGIALAEDKFIVIVGPEENVFHYIDYVVKVESVEELRECLRDL